MNEGDKVMIYSDPFTKQKPEGLAVLKECRIRDAQDSMEYWDVEFVDERGRTYGRWVDTEDA